MGKLRGGEEELRDRALSELAASGGSTSWALGLDRGGTEVSSSLNQD